MSTVTDNDVEYRSYSVVEGDSLRIIAEDNELVPENDWARKIWERNTHLHKFGKLSGKKVNRKLYLGKGKYANYEHSKWKAGYRAYDDPHNIILYVGETLEVPRKKDAEIEDEERIVHEISDDELINGFKPDYGKKYKVVIPEIRVRIDKEIDGIDDFKYTLMDTERSHYSRTLTVGEHKVEVGNFVYLKFQGTPRNLRYDLEVEPAGNDENGNPLEKYFAFKDEPYSTS